MSVGLQRADERRQPGRRLPGGGGADGDGDLLSLRFKAVWRALRREDVAFWLLCTYVGVEYLRPQAVYPSLDVLPWGKIAIAGCLLATLFAGKRAHRMNGLDAVVLAFFLWIPVTVALAWDPAMAMKNWTLAASWGLLYFLLVKQLTTPRKMLLFWLALMVINLKMSQFGVRTFAERGFSFADWGVTGSPGWFQNSGEFAMEMTAFMGMSWCLLLGLQKHLEPRRFKIYAALLPGTALVSIIASSSRGSQLGGLAVIFAVLVIHKVRLRSLVLVAMTLLLGWIVLPAEQKARFETAGSDKTSESRLAYWGDAWDITLDNPLSGVGYENWIPYYQMRTGDDGIEQVHNTVLESSVELGLPGAALFITAVLMSFLINARSRKMAHVLGQWSATAKGMAYGLDAGMVGLFVSAQFMSVLFLPVFWMGLGLTSALHEMVRQGTNGPLPKRPNWPRGA